MMRNTAGIVRLVPALLLLGLAGCAGFAPGPVASEAHEHEQTVTACRQRADRAYDMTNRDQIYAPASQVNTPFSANYQPGIPDRGLSGLYAHDRMVSDCVRNTGAEGDRTPPTAPPPSGPNGRP